MTSMIPALRRSVTAAGLAVLAAAAPARAQQPAVIPDTALTLGEAARRAAHASAIAQAAQARTAQASARVIQARSALLPSLRVDAAQRQRTFNTAEMGISFPSAPGQPPVFDPDGEVLGPVNVYDLRGRLTQSLFNPAAITRVQASRAALRASGADAASQEQYAAAIAAGAYLRTLRADAQLSARVADSTLAAELLTIAREQLAAGTGIALDVTRAAAQLAATRATLIAARGERDRTRLDLARAVGAGADAQLVASDSLAELPLDVAIPDEAEAVRTALEQRPDLRAIAAQLEAVQGQIRAVRAERLPTLSAFVDDGAIGKSVDHLRNTYAWGLQASLPVFEGFRRRGRVEEQQAVAQEVEVRRRDLEVQAAVEVRTALLDLRTAREQVDATRERLQLAEQEVAQARERFAAGVSGNADVITASLSLNAARTAHVDALTAFQSARVALARAQGTLTDLP